jgi:roadblock/LC7 domain-containing protein
MVNLDRVMGLEGAIAAGEFSPTGELVSYKGNLPQDVARLLARTCAANHLMGTSEVEHLSHITGDKRWLPFHGFAVSAGDYSLCVMGHAGVFVETAKADFNGIFHTLGQLEQEELKAA